MHGRSTIGSISFGTAFVTGRKARAEPGDRDDGRSDASGHGPSVQKLRLRRSSCSASVLQSMQCVATGRGDQPLLGDLLAAGDAEAVLTGLDALERFLDLVDEHAFPVADAELEVPVRLLRTRGRARRPGFPCRP
jgi:hypothetical protein